MKRLPTAIIILLVFLSSCGLNERERTIKSKEAELNNRQQALVLREQQLANKENDLREREHRLDSTKKEMDSVVIHGPSIVGKWQVKMQCVETSCSGSALGDVKTEQWEFSSKGNEVVVKVFEGKNLSRIYNGNYTSKGMQLFDKSALSTTTMEVTLRMLNDKKMDGLREIVLPDCKTTYSITAERL